MAEHVPERAGERAALLAAAQRVLREHGLGAVTVAEVLARTGLGTRAFYRHFSSKDQLLLAAFEEATRTEVARLAALMADAGSPSDAVAAWIEGRLALAFDAGVRSDLRPLSEQARALHAVDPETMAALQEALLAPLVEQLAALAVARPDLAAQSVASVVWACVEREWSRPSADPEAVRTEVVRFCLAGAGSATI